MAFKIKRRKGIRTLFLILASVGMGMSTLFLTLAVVGAIEANTEMFVAGFITAVLSIIFSALFWGAFVRYI